MKKSTFLTFALCAGMPLLAQAPNGLQVSKGDSSVTVYGILDAGVAQVAHTLDFDSYHPVAVNPNPSKGPDSAMGMFNGGISQSRFGIKGSTELTEGWKAIFTLEGAINVPSGNVSNAALGIAQSKSPSSTVANNVGNYMSADSSISGQLFNRGAYFGVSHATYGTITIGRQMSLMLEAIPGYDALQGAQLFTPIGFSGGYGGGGATDNSRIDSAIKYRVSFGDIKLGVLHKFGGVSGASSAKGADQINLAYESGNFGILAAYQTYKDAFTVGNPSGSTTTPAANLNGTVGQPLGTLVLTAQDTKSTWLAARYKVGPVLITAGYQAMTFTNPSDPINDGAMTSLYGQLVSTVNVTPYTIGTTEEDKKQTIWWLGAAWDVTSNFNVAVSYYSLKQDDFSQGTYNPATINNSKGEGTQKFTSLLLDYKFNKAFDAYFGYMGSKYADSLSSGLTNPTNSVTGLGIRYKF